MISYQWCSELEPEDRDEVLGLVAAAAAFDEEAGFSKIHPADVTATSDGSGTIFHLLVQARRDLSAREDAPLVTAAYLHLKVDAEGYGTVQFVVHPDYRSRGVATTLVEEMGLDAAVEGGWQGTGARALRCWAYSTHPAADRLTRRFDIRAAGRLWTIFRHLSGPFAHPLEPVTEFDYTTIGTPLALGNAAAREAIDHVLDASSLPAVQRERFLDEIRLGNGHVVIAEDASGKPAGFVWYDPALSTHLELRAAWIRALVLADAVRGSGLGAGLLTSALGALRGAGAQVGLMRIDPDNAAAVRMCRLMWFEQEEEHSCFQVGDWVGIPGFPR